MFEPVWNSNYVDHVQITMAEDIGIGGRAGYYDGIGAARDVIQNHLLQLMALIAMEEPVSFDARACGSRSRRSCAARAPGRGSTCTRPAASTAAGWEGGEKVGGYLEESGIPATSTTETYAAIKLEVDTRRWAGVPFYLRAGKRLGRRVTEVAVVFKRAPHLPFNKTATEELGPERAGHADPARRGRHAAVRRQGARAPRWRSATSTWTSPTAASFVESSPEAYERLILDVLLGDPPLFPQHEEVELSWRILDPIIEYWAEHGKPDTYQSGTWGPQSSDEMLARDGRAWRRP